MGFWSDLFGKRNEEKKEETTVSAPHAAVRVEVTPSDSADVVDEIDEDEETEAFVDPDEYETDDFGPFAHLAQNPTMVEFEEFWYQIFQLESAQAQGEQAFEEALSALGIRNEHHLRQIRETFLRHFGHMSGFDQSLFNARTRQSKEAMQAATAGNVACNSTPACHKCANAMR